MLRSVAATGMLLALLSACAASSARPKSVVALPNGYYLQPNAKLQTQIVKRQGGNVVPGPIAAYAVSGQVVAGALGEPPPESRGYTNDLPFKGNADTRYFVLDTTSGKLDSNLDSAGWQQRLGALGVPQNLRIYAPLRWQ